MKPDRKKNRAFQTLVVAYEPPLIPLQPGLKKPRPGFSWKCKATGKIKGYTRRDQIKNDRYGLASHTISTATADIDTIPGIDKKQFRAQTEADCIRQLDDYIDNDLLAGQPGLRNKIIHRQPSESGKGIHIMFWQPNTNWQTGWTHESWGEFFNGDGYFIPANPVQLLKDLKNNFFIDPLTEADIHYLTRTVPAPKHQPETEPPTEPPPFLDFIPALKSIAGDRFHDWLSDNPELDENGFRKYRWSLYELGDLLNCFPLSDWQRRSFRRLAKMCVRDISNDPILLTAFQTVLEAAGCGHCRPERDWWLIERKLNREDRVSMGTLCWRAGYRKVRTDLIDEWMAECLCYEPGNCVSMDELRRAFSKWTPMEIKPQTFTRHVNSRYCTYDSFLPPIAVLGESHPPVSDQPVERIKPKGKFKFRGIGFK